MRPFYSKHVRHCMRFFVRYPSPKFTSDADKQNWEACKSALDSFTNKEKELLVAVYTKNDTMPDNVYKVSTENSIKQDTVWKLINELERRVAKRRNLI